MSTPVFSEFNPKIIPWQYEIKKFIRTEYDYEKNGVLECLLSGTVGSAKSILAINLGVSHCLLYPEAQLGLFRRAMPDLKDTMVETMVDHLEGSEIVVDDTRDVMREGVHYVHNKTRGTIEFLNGAKVISKSWADKRYKKLRSHPFSCAILEELTENTNAECEGFHPEIISRMGRISSENSSVKENWILYLTNPDQESHWGYKYFIEHPERYPNRKVIYSKTTDNPFIPKTYIENLRNTLSPLEAMRKLEGKWVDDMSDKIYSCYDRNLNYKDEEYELDPKEPIHISYDFNIGEGKPLSACIFQYIKGHYHFYDETVISTARTNESLDDLAARGIFETKTKYIIHGDAYGKSRSTNSLLSDYDIIEKFMSNYENKDGKNLDYEMGVLKSNPPIRTRHNLLNGYMLNANGKRRLTVYKTSPTLDKGFRLTTLKAGGQYIEDDGPAHPYQHITTAAGYAVNYIDLMDSKVSRSYS